MKAYSLKLVMSLSLQLVKALSFFKKA